MQGRWRRSKCEHRPYTYLRPDNCTEVDFILRLIAILRDLAQGDFLQAAPLESAKMLERPVFVLFCDSLRLAKLLLFEMVHDQGQLQSHAHALVLA